MKKIMYRGNYYWRCLRIEIPIKHLDKLNEFVVEKTPVSWLQIEIVDVQVVSESNNKQILNVFVVKA